LRDGPREVHPVTSYDVGREVPGPTVDETNTDQK